MNTLFQSRDAKVKFLTDFLEGRTTVQRLLQPTSAIKYIYADKSFIEYLKDGVQRREHDVNSFEQENAEAITHVVTFKSYTL